MECTLRDIWLVREYMLCNPCFLPSQTAWSNSWRKKCTSHQSLIPSTSSKNRDRFIFVVLHFVIHFIFLFSRVRCSIRRDSMAMCWMGVRVWVSSYMTFGFLFYPTHKCTRNGWQTDKSALRWTPELGGRATHCNQHDMRCDYMCVCVYLVFPLCVNQCLFLYGRQDKQSLVNKKKRHSKGAPEKIFCWGPRQTKKRPWCVLDFSRALTVIMPVIRSFRFSLFYRTW